MTAQRQPVAALATPLSIGRVDRDAIELLGATHSSEALNRVPGVMVQRGSGQESLTAIRSPVLTGAGSCGAFLFLENGVPIRPVGFCNVNEMLEINTEQADAIEILRGTGSALYGSNSVHGTINVLQDAPPDLPRWQLGLGLGPDQYTRGSLVASHQGETTACGIKALYTHDGGWRDQSGFDEGKLNATLTTGAGGSIPSRFDLAATKLEQQTAGFILGENAYRDPDLRQQNLNPEAYRDAHAVRLTGLVQPQASLPGRLELRPYFRTSRMDFLQHFLLGQPVERNGQESAGVMTSFDWDLGDRVSLITGLDLEWADSFLVEDQENPTTGGSPAANAIRPAGLHYDYSVTSNVAGGYAQLDYALTPSLHAGAGVRVEYVNYDYDNHMLAGNTDENGVPCLPAGCLYSRPADRSDSFTNAAPKLSLRWDAATGLMLYANASRGFRPPEMTELYRLQRNQSVADLDSEQVDAYEIGLKFVTRRLARRNRRVRHAQGQRHPPRFERLLCEPGSHLARRRGVHADVAGAERARRNCRWHARQASLRVFPRHRGRRDDHRRQRRGHSAARPVACRARVQTIARRWPQKLNGSWWATTSSTPPMPIVTPATNC